MNRFGYFFLTACLMFAVQAPGAQSRIDRKAPDFQLRDQTGRDFSLQQYSGEVLVMLAGDQDGSEQNHQWGIRLREHFGNRIAIVGVADTRSVPFFLRGLVKTGFQKERVRVLLDWKGEWFTALGLPAKSANIILIDRARCIRRIYSCSAGESACDRIFTEIDQLLAE